MVRHCKEEIEDIPRPVWLMTTLPLNPIEATSYNAVVAMAKGNLISTGAYTAHVCVWLRAEMVTVVM
jgi:hypothetical protein